MKYRKFGRSGVEVSEVGLGTWTMGGMWGSRDDRAAIDAMVQAIRSGVNFFDTAWAYGEGHSEGLIASAIKEAKQKVFVATKIPPKNHCWPASHNIPVSEVFPADHIVEYTEKSLKNLRMDCVDLQQLHVWSDTWLQDTAWLAVVDKLKSQGKIKHFGVSINDHQPDSALKMVASGLIDSVQVIYNIFDQSPEKELFPLCLKHGVAVIVRVPFDEGSLTGTFTPDMVFPKKDWRKHYFTTERLPETCARVEKLKKFLGSEIKTLSELALKFCLAHPAVTTVIPGMRKTSHVEANCAVSDGKPLSTAILPELKSHAWLRNFYPFQ